MGRPRRALRWQGRLLISPSPYDALSALDTGHGDWLDPRDGGALRALLRARYGETYAHRRLYTPGVLEGAWSARALLSLGQRRGDTLDAHTGFWFMGDGLVESGLTVTRPGLPSTPPVDLDALWSRVLGALSSAGVLALTQRTTTLHPIAQHLALTHMRALPTGLRPNYTRGERITGLDSAPGVMHALSMITTLNAPAGAVIVPDDAWGGWLADLADPLGLEVSRSPATPSDHALSLTPLADDPSFGARRARVALDGDARRITLTPAHPPRRVELRHVPARDVSLVATAHAALLERRFLPVGWRLGAEPEIIYQLVLAPEETSASMANASLANGSIRALWNTWRTLCAHTS